LNQTQYSENFVIGDARPDAPELAKRGTYGVGVRTLKVVNPDQLDVLNYSASNPNPRYDRPLTLEVWYPALIPAGVQPIAWYSDVLGNGPNNPDRPNTPFEFAGRALRDAAPNPQDAPYPLVIVSHGYPGSRVLMTWLTENLVSKGYLVVALDHTESTHGDSAGFASTQTI
jgi:predicted dienelactone hydrolase